MALIFWDGFDSYNSTSELSAVQSRLVVGFDASFGDVPALIGGAGRFGGKGMRSGSYTNYGLVNTADFTPTELYQGKAVYNTGVNNIMAFWGSTVVNASYPDIYLRVDSGYVYAYRMINNNGTTILIGQSSTAVAPYNSWHWLEARCVKSSTNSAADGILEVWVNNQKVISNTATPTIQNNGSTYLHGSFGFHRFAPSGSYWDDPYCLDTSGPAPWNTRLGDCRIASIAVNSDAGPNDGTVSTGNTNHWTVVDEIPYSAADWLQLSSLSSDAGEIFKKASIPSTNVFSVLATAVVAVGGKTDAGNAAFKLSIQSAGTRANSNTQYLSTTNTFYRQEWVTNPNTSSQWTTSEWEAANVGVYIV